MTKQVINWLLRAAFVIHRPGSASSGFVLPTTVLLILVVSLSVGALTYRAFTRNTQVITQNQQRVIYNAATPAIDRARSKLEYMFDQSKDIRYPSGGVPQETKLLNMMLNDASTGLQPITLATGTSGSTVNPYNLPDETRINLDTSTRTIDNAWSFETDMNGDNKTDGPEDATVVYSIIFQTPVAPSGSDLQKELVRMSDTDKSKAQVVRHGPLTTETGGACKVSTASASTSARDAGWFEDPSNTSIVRKNFQVDVLVIPHSQKSVAVTLEFQQDRQISKGNKWAAWFRNDLEVFPGPEFRWNGAMHTEGNFIAGNSNFKAYLISSTESCLYPPIENSEITITDVNDKKTGENFAGAVAIGRLGRVENSGQFSLHYQNGQAPAWTDINAANSGYTAANPSTIYSDPEAILTRDRRQTKAGTTDKTNRSNVKWSQLPASVTTNNRRLRANQEPSPYIDDLYRADDRWGPKPKYQTADTPPRDDAAGTGLGNPIPATNVDLVKNETGVTNQKPTDKTDESVGNDGYWERRARNEGLRVIVGERLELGNLFGWTMPHDTNGDKYIDPTDNIIDPTKTEREGDPLYPPEVAPYPVRSANQFLKHINRQHRTLRDNLSAVQATAIYHTDLNNTLTKDYPVACLASTAHPGTPTTLRDSIDFVPTRFRDTANNQLSLMSDFFMGRGTNGWEFEPPQKTPAAFEISLATGQPLRIALNNLANFAGDPKGAFPPVQDGEMHPYPALTMWGNFSNLRRALKTLDDGTSYQNLSVADKTYIQTASCTLGMMAYEIDMVQRFDAAKSDGSNTLMQSLGDDLYALMDGDISDNGQQGGGEVLPDSQIKTYLYYRKGKNGNGQPDPGKPYEPRDYYNVPPDAYIAALRQKYTESSGVNAVNDEKLRLAELLMLKYQIRRDRTFGFRPSPSFGHYVYGTNPRTVRVFPTACDPNEFQFNTADSGNDATPQSDRSRQRLGLSRLCGALNIPPGYNLSAALTAPERPVVMPKFPALYYLFPVQKHNLKGTLPATFKVDSSGVGSNTEIPDLPDEYDTRQPTGTIITTAPRSDLTTAALKDLLFTDDKSVPDDKFVEPYVSDTYNDKTAIKTYEFTPVQSDSLISSALPNPYLRRPYYNNDNADLSLRLNQYDPATGLPPISEPNPPAPDLTVKPILDARFPDKNRSPFPLAETAVDLVAVQPRQLNGFPASVASFSYQPWTLPTKTDVVGTSASNKANIPTNIIEVPKASGFSLTQVPYAVPFLDRAIFDGRQLMLTRVMDMDLGLMRSESIAGGQYNEPMLPMSGIVFAFREDAVREDAIARPADTSGNNRMSAIDPANPKDPKVVVDAAQGLIGISTKPVDYLPDPERRVHGFRLRNGAQIKRNSKFESGGAFTATDNYRGLSIFTDQPLYIQGALNLHQTGTDDTVGTALEEFRGPNALIRGTTFSENTFYKRGTSGNGEKDPDFAQPDKDRWRPTELLSDSISILSDNFCDGSVSDLFVNYDSKDYMQGKQHSFSNSTGAGGSFARGIYHDSVSGFKNTGLYGVGCSTIGKAQTSSETGLTSFRNSDQPFSTLPTATSGTGRFDWVRENPNPTSYTEKLLSEYDGSTAPAGDYMSPVKISRSGLPVLREPLRATPKTGCDPATGTKSDCNPTPGIRLYGNSGDPETKISNLAFRPIGKGDNNRQSYPTIGASTNVNSIVVSGIVPSRPGQSYGGLQNFPRFIENWDSTILDYSGSFLQLSFSNYATAPWEMEAWEYNNAGTLDPDLDMDNEQIQFYSPPTRSWGYDVALQLAAAGPAASRFVINTPSRNEFYSEPQINDPYIKTLCRAAKATSIQGAAKLNCDN